MDVQDDRQATLAHELLVAETAPLHLDGVIPRADEGIEVRALARRSATEVPESLDDSRRHLDPVDQRGHELRVARVHLAGEEDLYLSNLAVRDGERNEEAGN